VRHLQALGASHTARNPALRSSIQFFLPFLCSIQLLLLRCSGDHTLGGLGSTGAEALDFLSSAGLFNKFAVVVSAEESCLSVHDREVLGGVGALAGPHHVGRHAAIYVGGSVDDFSINSGVGF
jgi:hypothetical protein